MTKAKRVLLVWLVLLLSSVLASCVPPRPTEDDVVGVWVERLDRSNVKDAGPNACFQFASGGRFSAFNTPRQYFISEGQSRPLTYVTRIDATGTWELDLSSKDPFAVFPINLRFDPGPKNPFGFYSHLRITYPPKRALLAGLPDDPDAQFYKRAEPTCEQYYTQPEQAQDTSQGVPKR
jgi:hypothetical protein